MTLLLRQINCIKQYIVLILLILDLIIFERAPPSCQKKKTQKTELWSVKDSINLPSVTELSVCSWYLNTVFFPRASVNSVESGRKQFITWKSRYIHFSCMNTSHLENSVGCSSKDLTNVTLILLKDFSQLYIRNGNSLQCSSWKMPWTEEPGRL